jgi:hypothetical protein
VSEHSRSRVLDEGSTSGLADDPAVAAVARSASPWLAYEGRVHLFARCVSPAELMGRRGDAVHTTLDGHAATLAVATDRGETRFRIVVLLRGYPPELGDLDHAGSCRHCGRAIVDALITADGVILIAH